jgi:hypothetical protein
MRKLISISLMLCISAAWAGEDQVKEIALITGVKLNIKQIQISRTLPTAYYDQALSSIPGVYPKSKILAKRRFGRFGADLSSSYSMVCYKKSSKFDEVTVEGIVVGNGRAWRYESKVEESLFVDTLILILEKIAELPSNKKLQPAEIIPYAE